MNLSIIQATINHIDDVVDLFDRYRIFYGQKSDLNGAKNFITERLNKQDSVILLATKGEVAIGYTQLFPSFSSVSMQRVWILNDLFVVAEARNQGVAKALINAVQDYGIATKAVRIILATEVSNVVAQNLYETMGYRKFDEFYHYILAINS